MHGIRDNLVEKIHASGYKACIAISGGGIGAVHAMLARPGASRFVLDVRIPYSCEAMNDFLGETPELYCSEETARKMAAVAHRHAASITSHAIGIACTAALQTTHGREDADRAYLCIYSEERTVCRRVELEQSSREEQDAAVSEALLSLIARFVAE